MTVTSVLFFIFFEIIATRRPKADVKAVTNPASRNCIIIGNNTCKKFGDNAIQYLMHEGTHTTAEYKRLIANTPVILTNIIADGFIGIDNSVSLSFAL